MKNLILLTVLTMTTTFTMAQSQDVNEVKKVITNFSKAGDVNDAETLSNYLDENYRVVMNRLFGSPTVSVMPKATYLEKIKNKEFGGEKRELTIEGVNINGSTASAKVTFAGTKMTFVSIIVLVKDAGGQWKLISDVPVIL